MGPAPRVDVFVILAGRTVTAAVHVAMDSMAMDVPVCVTARTMGHVTMLMGLVDAQQDSRDCTVKKYALLASMV